MNQQHFSPPSHRDPPLPFDPEGPGCLEVVWGVPSDEMLHSEQEGDIVLVHDVTRRFPPQTSE